MAFAVKSTLDVVFWFTDQALNDREYIQPQKMHRLLYLAQAYYGVAFRGQKLMPATFVTDAMGPVEPTIFHMYEYGRPYQIQANKIPDPVSHFLESIWRKFGAYTADQLTKRVAAHPPVAEAMAKGVNEEIGFDVMLKFYSSEAAPKRGAPAVDDVVRPRVMRSQDGRPVAVKAWAPKAVTVKKD